MKKSPQPRSCKECRHTRATSSLAQFYLFFGCDCACVDQWCRWATRRAPPGPRRQPDHRRYAVFGRRVLGEGSLQYGRNCRDSARYNYFLFSSPRSPTILPSVRLPCCIAVEMRFADDGLRVRRWARFTRTIVGFFGNSWTVSMLSLT